MNVLKKKKFLLSFFVSTLFVFIVNIFVFADDNPKINIQGRLTKDYGDPITGKQVKIKIGQNGSIGEGSSVDKTDSEGLYNVIVNLKTSDILANTDYALYIYDASNDVQLASTTIKFQYVPFSIYSSTATYAFNAGTATIANSLSSSFQLTNNNISSSTIYSNLKISTQAGDNFISGKVYQATTTYSQKAGTATYANYAQKVSTDSMSSYSSGYYVLVSSKDSDNNVYQYWASTTTWESGADLAEMYASSENLQPGDVVSIDTTKNDAVVKTKVAEDTKVAGVVSTEPGLLLNKNQKGYKLALVGKVPTKVCNEGGNIKRGDLLVSASVAGYAKKAGTNPKPGTIIGKALANFSSKKGTILVLVNLQ